MNKALKEAKQRRHRESLARANLWILRHPLAVNLALIAALVVSMLLWLWAYESASRYVPRP